MEMLLSCNSCAQLLIPNESKDRGTKGRAVWKVGSINPVVA